MGSGAELMPDFKNMPPAEVKAYLKKHGLEGASKRIYKRVRGYLKEAKERSENG